MYYYDPFMSDNVAELYHHGILGQKWGQRRFQNPDGTLTAAGRKRYFKSDGSLTRKGKEWDRERRITKANRNRVNERAAAKTMSDDELQSRINRLKLENTYLQLLPEPKKQKTIAESLKETAGRIIKKSFEDGASSAGSKIIEATMLRAADEAFAKKTGVSTYVSGIRSGKKS